MLKKVLKKIIPSKLHPKLKQVLMQINIILYAIDSITFKNVIKKTFYNRLGYRLNLKNPRSFNEKIIRKKLYDRNPLLPLTTDKYRVRHILNTNWGKNRQVNTWCLCFLFLMILKLYNLIYFLRNL